jgi:hypothetical protein
LKVSKASKSDRIDVPSHRVRDEQLAAAIGKKTQVRFKNSIEILPATRRFANGQDKATLLKVLFETIDRLEKNS